jgi:hypothetical protein
MICSAGYKMHIVGYIVIGISVAAVAAAPFRFATMPVESLRNSCPS